MAGLEGGSSSDSVETTSPWRNSTALQTYSRAFEGLFAVDKAGAGQPSEDRFFVPSYLKGSTYVRRLAEEHEARLQAQRESKQTTSTGLSGSLPSFPPSTLPSGSHRGMSHNVIERSPHSDEDDCLAPLPTKWNKDDMWGGIEILGEGRDVKYSGPKNHHERDHEACAVRADHYMPPQCGIYYYEVLILSSKRDDTTIAIGFSTKTATLSRPVGWEPESWAYHGDDGRCFTAQNVGRYFGPTFNTGDVVGCGVNFRDKTAFFTKNGVKIGTAFNEVHRGNGKLYPSISLKKPGEVIRVNFGQTPFVYNIEDMMKEQREKIQSDIDDADTSQLEPGTSESDFVQALVLQFLQHDGYVETARAFANEMQLQKEALNLDPNVRVDGVSVRDDEDANNRQRIRSAILDGDIDRALKHTKAFYPTVLDENEQVAFKLKCRKFIEMVRKAAQLKMDQEQSKSNGRLSSMASQKMDLDHNGTDHAGWQENVEMGGIDSQGEVEDLERSMLDYGKALQADYAKDPRKEITKTLEEIWLLMAYQNPLKAPEVSHLLNRSGRAAVAEELNSAILLSLGKSSRASIEKLYAQTTVLLDDLRQDGGDSAFVSVQDIVDKVTKQTEL